MTGKIVVTGDVHLGAANTDGAAFNTFLGERYRDRDEVERLVLLGDVWDLVRRDPFGCAWETSETITRLKRLADEVPVHFVFGNHDTHLRHLDPSLYDMEFRDDLVLQSGDTSIRFCHGKAFDRLQSDALSKRLSGPGDRGDIDPTKGLKDPIVERGRGFIRSQKRRLRTMYNAVQTGEPMNLDPYPRRERRAHAYLDDIPEDKLVYGHTHSPYVRPDNAAANPGSWKSTAPIHNTYLVIENGDIALYRHRGGRTDERINTPVS